jgi:hypothetical protein
MTDAESGFMSPGYGTGTENSGSTVLHERALNSTFFLFLDDALYSEAIKVGEDEVAAVAVIHQLPDLHRLVFLYLVRFLQLFAR